MEKLNQKQTYIFIVIGAIMILVIGYYFYTKIAKNEEYEQIDFVNEVEINESKKDNEIKEEIIIHIAGEVKNPGIIRIQEGARIADIIEQAGGLNQNSDISDINLAYPVEDGQKIIIPKIGDKESIQQENKTNTISSFGETQNKKINLNKATIEQLQSLQGIRRRKSEVSSK